MRRRRASIPRTRRRMRKIRAMAQGEMARRLSLPVTLSVVRHTGRGRKEERKEEEMEEHAMIGRREEEEK